MNRERTVSTVMAAALAFLLSFCAMACVIAVYDMAVSLWLMALWCLAAAALCGSCCSTRLWPIPLVVLAGCVLWLVLGGHIVPGTESLVYTVSRGLHHAFGWKILRWSLRTGDAMAATLPPMVYLWGGLTAAICAWSVKSGQSAIPVVLSAVPPVLLCLFMVDNPPPILWLIGLVFALGTVVLTSTVRYHSRKQGIRLVLYSFFPMVLAVAILFITVSPVGYTGDDRAQALIHSAPVRAVWAFVTGQRLSDADTTDASRLNLAAVGPQLSSDAEVLFVSADHAGTLYLRGSAMDTYDGLSWADSGEAPTLPWPSDSKLTSIGEVAVSTRYAHRMLYLPYYTTSLELDGTGRGVENSQKLAYYTVACSLLPSEQTLAALYPSPTANNHTVSAGLMTQCTDLPDSTRRWAEDVLADAVPAGTVSYYHIAQAISDYVSQSARYDLDTPIMPATETDFARWFLENGQTGYCTHFATAATVLLRAAGIPARYVTGYLVNTQAGLGTSVPESAAHAWTEYYLPGFGWAVLEATPAATDPAPVVPEETPADPGFTLQVPWQVWVVLGALLVLGAVIQWPIRRYLRRRWLNQGDLVTQVLRRWQRYSALCRRRKVAPDRKLFQLAQKAKFSPHTPDPETLDLFDRHIAALEAAARSTR